MTTKVSGVLSTNKHECESYDDAKELFVHHTASLFDRERSDLEVYDKYPTHTIESYSRDYAMVIHSPKDFLHHLTNPVGDHTIRWRLDGDKLKMNFSHHDAPSGVYVHVTPITWVKCKNEECDYINASEAWQNEILRTYFGIRRTEFQSGYCKYCAPHFHIELENVKYLYQVAFTLSGGDTYSTVVETDIEAYPDAWWQETDTQQVVVENGEVYLHADNGEWYYKHVTDEDLLSFMNEQAVIRMAIEQAKRNTGIDIQHTRVHIEWKSNQQLEK